MERLNLNKESISEDLNSLGVKDEEEKNKLIEKCKEATDTEIAEMVDQIESYDEDGQRIIKEEVNRRSKIIDKEEKRIRKPRSNFVVLLYIIAGINIFQIVTGTYFNGVFHTIVIFLIYLLIKKIIYKK